MKELYAVHADILTAPGDAAPIVVPRAPGA